MEFTTISISINIDSRINIVKESLWTQFGASIDMHKNAIELWPDEYWETDKKFFYNAYHCLVFLDYYITILAPKEFSAPLRFTITESGDVPEEAIDDIIPKRIYCKNELLDYNNIEHFSQDVLVSQIELLLNYSNRFYNRQFIIRKTIHNDLIGDMNAYLSARFESQNRF